MENTKDIGFTIGQRKGLNLGGGPWFVVKKDSVENTIYVSNGYDPVSQYQDIIRLEDFHFISGNPWPLDAVEHEVTFKIRHTPDFTKGILKKEGGSYVIQSSVPVSGVAAGQFGVVYDEDAKICFGSGVIE